jgi:serine/threonine protein phosphatase PrpC
MPIELTSHSIHGPLEAALVAATDIGRKRARNEDSYMIRIPDDDRLLLHRGILFVVADGMGGHEAGDVASECAVESLVEAYFSMTGEDISDLLHLGVHTANLSVHTHARDSQRIASMGTTCVAGVIRGHELHLVNVGDSRAFLLRKGIIEQITEDHSWVMEQVKAGNLSLEDCRRHPRRNLITRALGIEESVEIDQFRRTLIPEDRLLLCSDGLWSYFSNDDLVAILADKDPEQAVRQLVDQANAAGGEDNITAILVHIQGFSDQQNTPDGIPESSPTPTPTRILSSPLSRAVLIAFLIGLGYLLYDWVFQTWISKKFYHPPEVLIQHQPSGENVAPPGTGI